MSGIDDIQPVRFLIDPELLEGICRFLGDITSGSALVIAGHGDTMEKIQKRVEAQHKRTASALRKAISESGFSL